MTRSALLSLLAVSLLLEILAPAQLSAQTPLTLDEALARVVDNPLYQARQQRVKALEGRVEQAGKRPNPVLEGNFLTGSILDRQNEQVISVMFLQTLERGGKRDLRTRIALEELEQAESDLAAYRISLEADVERTYLEIQHFQETEARLAESLEEIQGLIDYDTIRIQEGEVPPLNPVYLRAEVSRLELRREQVRIRIRQARRQLNALLGRDAGEEFSLQPYVPELSLPPLEAVLRSSMQQHPALRRARSRRNQSELQIELERARAKQDWELGVGYERFQSRHRPEDFEPPGVISSLDDSSNLIGVRLNIPLPLWDDNSGNIAAAIATNRGLEREVSAMEDRIRLEVTGAHQDAELNREQLATYDRLLEGLNRSYQSEQEAYRLTGQGVLDLLESWRLLQEASLDRLRTLLAARVSLVNLKEQSGIDIENLQNGN